MRILALCYTCRHKHPIDFDPVKGPPTNAFSDWLVKHPGHKVHFESPRRSKRDKPSNDPYLGLLDNADIKIAYGTEAALTITLASLATSSSKVAGRASTVVDNTTNKYLDALVAGKVTTGTSPTDVKSIDVYAYGQVEDTPTYPDSITGSDADKTITSTDIRNAGLNFLFDTATNNTSDRVYWFKPVSLAGCFGGALPPRWGLWVTHDTGVNLNSTGSNHAFWYQPVYATST